MVAGENVLPEDKNKSRDLFMAQRDEERNNLTAALKNE